MVSPVTATRSPGEGRSPLVELIKTPALASCTKNRPFQFGSATVTTPVMETGSLESARSGVSARISEAFVRISFDDWAATEGPVIKPRQIARSAATKHFPGTNIK